MSVIPRKLMHKSKIIAFIFIFWLCMLIFYTHTRNYKLREVNKSIWSESVTVSAKTYFPITHSEYNYIDTNVNTSIRNTIATKSETEENAFGNNGKAVELPVDANDELKQYVEKQINTHGLNTYASDLMSLHRKLEDTRPKQCLDQKFLDDLPITDIIICFYNEPWTVLLRTVHSVIDRSPDHLIKEIILVDDSSDVEHTKKPLEDYWKNYTKVRIVRTTKREGLIRAKLFGFEQGTAPVATFLDSHCECNVGWLEPLLDRIARNSTTIPSPTIDFINYKNFEYTHTAYDNAYVGSFSWNLQFRWIWEQKQDKKRRKSIADPIHQPVMAGGLFSILREYFIKLGTYDPGYNFWGGENLELSFKTWLCGGTLEILPCSRVGHVAKIHHPYNFSIPVINMNSKRLADVWMDEYAKYFYAEIGKEQYNNRGDITERLKLKNSLQCKPFKWYLENIYPELYIPDESHVLASGELSVLNRTYCLDADFQSPGVKIFPCHGLGGNQNWIYTKSNEISRFGENCLDYSSSGLSMYLCHGLGDNQKWDYNSTSRQIRHRTGKCLTVELGNQQPLFLADCKPDSIYQQWTFTPW